MRWEVYYYHHPQLSTNTNATATITSKIKMNNGRPTICEANKQCWSSSRIPGSNQNKNNIIINKQKNIYNILDQQPRWESQMGNTEAKCNNETFKWRCFLSIQHQPGLLPIMILQSTRGSCNMIQKSWTHQPNHNKYKNWLNTRVSLQNKKPTKMNTQQSTNKVQGTILIHSDDAPIKQKIKIYQSQSTSTDGITKKVTWKSKHVTINQKDPSAHHYVYVYLFVHQIINLETSVYSE